MAVRIVVDSSCDVDQSTLKAWNVDLLPIRVFFGDEAYIPGETLSTSEFYEKLSQVEELPKTAQITPLEFEEALAPMLDNGDEVVLIPISRELSGTYNSALIAKSTAFEDKPLYVVDSLTVTFAMSLLVYEAVKLRDKGLTAADICNELERLIPRLCLVAAIDDLKYLRLGGRLSSTSAVMGSLLGIKPIITIKDGKVENIHKTRGLKAANQYLINSAVDKIDSNYPLVFGHANIPQAIADLKKAADEVLTYSETFNCDIGPIVGTHCGPGAYGFVFICKEDMEN